MKVTNIKYTYKDTLFDAFVIEILPSLNVDGPTYDEVYKALSTHLKDYKCLRILSFDRE